MEQFQPEDRAMMGEGLVMQESLFYEYLLEDRVPSDHPLRRIDRFVDCSGLRQHPAGFYSTGLEIRLLGFWVDAICDSLVRTGGGS